MSRRKLAVANPSNPASLRAVSLITDRAKRYRANTPENRPPAPRQCIVCNSKRNVEVMHLSGDESDGSPLNLDWGCRACNTRLGAAFRRLGLGVPTRQYNPSGGAKTLGAWISAIQVVHGEQDGDLAAAVDLIRSTPHERRRSLQRQAWAARRRKYGRTGRVPGGGGADEIPF